MRGLRQLLLLNLQPSRINRLFAMTLTTQTPEQVGNTGAKLSTATFAAGCFWGVELAFQRLNGVAKTQVGYTNGQQLNPTYRDVCSGQTGHAEAVEIKYDSSVVSFNELLSKFWSIHDPTTLNRQKNDIGTQYRSGIYYHSEEQKQQATESKVALEKKLSRPIVTEIAAAATFYPAEDYHQQYLEKGGQCAATGCADRIRCYG